MSARDRTLAGVAAVVLLIGAYWFLGLAPRRADAGKLATQIADQQQKLTTATSDLATALKAKQDYARNYAQVARLGQAVPADDEVQSLVFQLDSAAKAAGVDFRGAKLVPDAAAAAPTTTPSTSTSGSSSSATPTSTTPSTTSTTPATASAGATAASTSQAVTSTLPPGAAVGAAGFPTMPFQLTFAGSFSRMAGFFHRLDAFVQAGGQTVQVGGRLLSIDGVSLAVSPKGFPQVTASVAATAYLVPAAEGATAGATAAAPATGSTASSAPATATVVPVTP